jgi:hypothetical protein
MTEELLRLYIVLTAVICFVVGFIVCFFVVCLCEESAMINIEKSGVWKIKDRAYRLTRMDPRSQP